MHSTVCPNCGNRIELDFKAIVGLIRCPNCNELYAPPRPPAIEILVAEADIELVVIGPHSDATAEDLRGLGQALDRWKAEFPQARHIFGLTELLDGRRPRTHPMYLMVPIDPLDDRYDPVALVYVAEGTPIEEAARDLYERLSSFRDKLAWFGPPDEYSYYQR